MILITIKHIFGKVPKLFRWLIVTVFIAPILVYVVVQFSTNKPIELFPENLIYLLLLILFLLTASYIVGSFRSVRELLTIKNSISKNSSNDSQIIKKKLPYSEVTIGNYKTQDICADIRAKIILDESHQPAVDLFLDRIRKGEPFCPECSRPMDYWKATWMADFAQIGYQCFNCDIKHKGNYEDLLNDIKGEVRKNYEKYWDIYKGENNKLTKGNPEDYQLPK